jgi:hypothetical protein
MAALRAADSPQPSASTCDLSQSSRLCLRSSPVLLNSRSASLPPPRPTASATFARVEMPIFKRPVWMPCGLQWLHLNIAASRQMNASASCTIQHSDRLHEIFFSFSSFSPLTTASIPPARAGFAESVVLLVVLCLAWPGSKPLSFRTLPSVLLA